MAKRSKSSGRWLREHFDDEFVQRAQKEGWRSRAVFKLQEIDRSERLLRPGMTVVDLGAAPGGWSQYAARLLGEKGRVLGIDLSELFITGSVSTGQTLSVTKTAHHKCGRCWRHLPEVSDDGALCARCDEVVNG